VSLFILILGMEGVGAYLSLFCRIGPQNRLDRIAHPATTQLAARAWVLGRYTAAVPAVPHAKQT
jgi:hypothetical protein